MSNQQVTYTLSLRDMLTKQLDKAVESSHKLETSMSGIKNVLGALGVAGGAYGLVQFARSVFDAGSKVEDATTGLTTLLKDSKQAAQVVQNTMEDATKAPFGFESLLSANKALISAGVNSNVARKDVMNLANAIAATGGGDDELQRMVVNLQQISNTGEATAMDMKQFAFAGVNLTKVLNDAGIKLAKGQNATYDQITFALRKAHEEGGIYFNGLENMMNNASVKASNLEDAFFQLKVQVFNGVSPALGEMLDFLTKGVTWIQENTNQIKALAIGVGSLYTSLKIAVPLMEGFGLASTAMLGPLGLVVTAVAGFAYVMWEFANQQDRINQMNDKSVKTASDNIKSSMQERTDMYIKQGMKQADAVKMVSEATKKTYLADISEVNKDIEATQSKMRTLKNLGYSSQAEDMQTGLQNLMQKKRELEGGLAGVNEFAGVTTPTAGMPTAGPNGANPTPSKSKSVAQGTKVTTINVSIKDLIGEYNMNVSNVREGSEKVKQMVVDALVGAVNDFQLIVQ